MMSEWSPFLTILKIWKMIYGPMCPGSLTVGMIATWHVIQGALLLLGPPAVLGPISIHALVRELDHIAYKQVDVGIALLVFSALAMYAMHNRNLNHILVCLILLPQQLILLLVWARILAALIDGQYADGYIPSGGSWFICADQSLGLIAPFFYTVAMIARSRSRELGFDQ